MRSERIVAKRLSLQLLTAAALQATASKDLPQVRQATQLHVPAAWLDLAWLAAMRLEQLAGTPAYQPWSIRAIALRHEPVMVGFINCHGTPKDGRIELGYEIFPAYQRQGYAFEAVSAFLRWAKRQGVTETVFSISPGNQPSLALNRKLGAEKIGSHIDEVDGLEDIYLLRL
jgi:ribosomal-protein-alanine N-acetyltransferase